MATSRSHTIRQSLHIHIDPSPYDPEVIISPDSNSPSPLSAHVSVATARTTPTSGGSDRDEFSVLCMHDFHASDGDQLSFRKNEILVIVKQENTGWWAAMRKGGDVIGWIPKAFVNPLTEEMAERLLNVREELRVYEYDAEQLYSAPISRNNHLYDPDPVPGPPQKPVKVSPRVLGSIERNGHDQRQNQPSWRGVTPYSSSQEAHKSHKYTPPSPTTPMPQPPNRFIPSLNKPTPPTPNEEDMTQDSRYVGGAPSMRRKPMIDSINIRGITSPDPHASFDATIKRPWGDKGKKTSQVDDYLQPVLVLEASVPWYLQPRFMDQLVVDADGQVRSGTVPALLEKLLANGDGKNFQDVFLMTFRSFMTADGLFDALVEYYHDPIPDGLSALELEDWEERGKLRTQRKVLDVFTDWLQSNHLLREEPHIAGRLTDFLQSITTGPNTEVAKLIEERIKDLTFSIGSPINASSAIARRTKKSKLQKGELLGIDPSDIAEQLSIIQYESYSKISPTECILYAKSQKGSNVANLREFCASHDKVVSWVQTSILTVEAPKRRAETIDYWIKVAEKCRSLNSIASMSAITTALSNAVIARLPLTWAHVGRRSNLDTLIRFNDPAGGFATCRSLLNNVEGPCVPLINMYLIDLAHIQDQYVDKESQVYFYKRKRFYDVVSSMLRHQNRTYPFALDEVAGFIRNHLQEQPKDPGWFWSKSHEVQQSELAHADIRKGLEKAGF